MLWAFSVGLENSREIPLIFLFLAFFSILLLSACMQERIIIEIQEDFC